MVLFPESKILGSHGKKRLSNHRSRQEESMMKASDHQMITNLSTLPVKYPDTSGLISRGLISPVKYAALILRGLILILILTSLSLANEVLPEARELKGLVYQDLYDSARDAIARDDYDKAENILDVLLENYPADADAQLMRGRVLAWQERYVEAEKDLLEVTRNTPEYTDAWYALTDLYFWWDRFEEAEKSCRVCLQQDPENPDFHVKYARILIALRRYAQARQALLAALDLGADRETVRLFLDDIRRVQNPRVWEAGFSLDFQTFNTNKGDWWGMVESVKRDFESWSLLAEAGRYWRYETVDQQLALEVYADAWQNAYWNARGAIGWKHEFLPHFDLYAELYQGFWHNWEGSVSVRQMVFSTKRIHIPSIALAVYQGPFYLRYKFNFIMDEDNHRVFHYASARYYYKTVDHYVETAYGYGRNLEWIRADMSGDDAHVWILRGQHAMHDRWIFQWLMDFQLNPNEETQRGGRIGFFYRW
jgi:YaiO family outer membrane protein